MLAMNRLRHAYLKIEPGLEPYFSTGHHDDERGLVATYMLDHPSRRWLLVHFVINTPTIVATVDAALAAAIAVLVLQAGGAATAALVAGGVVAFVAVWGGLMPLQRHSVDPLRQTTPRFPAAPELTGQTRMLIPARGPTDDRRDPRSLLRGLQRLPRPGGLQRPCAPG